MTLAVPVPTQSNYWCLSNDNKALPSPAETICLFYLRLSRDPVDRSSWLRDGRICCWFALSASSYSSLSLFTSFSFHFFLLSLSFLFFSFFHSSISPGFFFHFFRIILFFQLCLSHLSFYLHFSFSSSHLLFSFVC